jgi:hypothetical protein
LKVRFLPALPNNLKLGVLVTGLAGAIISMDHGVSATCFLRRR